MLGNFDDLNVRSVRRRTRNLKPSSGQQGLVFAIEFITMAMTLANLGFAVGSRSDGIRLKLAFPCAQAHRAPKFINTFKFTKFVDDSMRGARIKFARVCVMKSTNVTREFDTGGLHAQADSEV